MKFAITRSHPAHPYDISQRRSARPSHLFREVHLGRLPSSEFDSSQLDDFAHSLWTKAWDLRGKFQIRLGCAHVLKGTKSIDIPLLWKYELEFVVVGTVLGVIRRTNVPRKHIYSHDKSVEIKILIRANVVFRRARTSLFCAEEIFRFLSSARAYTSDTEKYRVC